MLYKIPELVIDNDDPFKNDRLNRKESIDVLTDFVSSFNGDFALCIDSGWGTGKTTFIRMWEQYLKNNGFYCIQFNAWESDFSVDPLVPLIGEIQAEIVDKLSRGKGKAKTSFKKAKEIGGVILRRAIPVALKIASHGVLDADEITETAIADALAEVAKKEIEEYESDKKTLRNFRDNLAEFASELTKENGKPLIFFIDELDRCRPNYAVELLERVKHLFDIPGIIFVLSLDRNQICHSIKSLYGQDMDVEGYLRRFIDLYFQLPTAPQDNFFDYLYELSGIAEYFGKRHEGWYEVEEGKEVLYKLAMLFNISLRIQEKCFMQFVIVLRTIPENNHLHPGFLIFLIILREGNPSLYRAFVQEEIGADRIIDYLSNRVKGEEFLRSKVGMFIEAYIASVHHAPYYQEAPRSIYQEKYDAETDEREKKRYGRILEIIKSMGEKYSYNILDYLVKKIEFSEKFKR